MAINSKIKGLDALLKKLDNVESELYNDIDAITEANAQAIVLQAKANINRTGGPKAFGDLGQSGKVEPNGKLSYISAFTAQYSGYVEFGTGTKVSIPRELKDQAAKFKNGNSGSFKEGLISIKDWCRKKGIDEKAAYPILVSLIREGQHAQPFLYPAWVKGKERYYKDLKTLLDKEFKNI